MTRRQKWTIMAPLGVCALLVVWIALSAANVRAASVSLLIYGLANLVVYTDAIDFILRLFMRRRHTATAVTTEENKNVSIDLTSALPDSLRHRVPLRPFAIVASVYNLARPRLADQRRLDGLHRHPFASARLALLR
jgi:hypothetical protein